MTRISKFSSLLLVTLITITAIAQGKVAINLLATIERDNQQLSAEGTVVKPGDVITWSIEATNNEDFELKDFAPTAMIPKGTEYIENSASGASAAIEFSIDGGNNYSGKPMIRERGPDNVEREVPAPVSAYTNIRFKFSNLSPGKTKTIYQVRVK